MAARTLDRLLEGILRRLTSVERRLGRGTGGGGGGSGGAPAGTIFVWSAATVPDGYLAAEGQAVSRADYADLFAMIGTTYGTGNGSTTFNVPDLRGRVPVGLQPGDVDFGVLGAAGGAKTHTLTTAQMPSHTHTQNAHAHDGRYHVYVANAAWNSTRPLVPSQGPSGGSGVGGGVANAVAATTATNQNTGGGGAHNNLQPFRVLRYIIKAVGGIGSLTAPIESVLLGRIAALEEVPPLVYMPNAGTPFTEGLFLRKVGSLVVAGGAVSPLESSGTWTSSWTSIGRVPIGYRPPQATPLSATANINARIEAQILTAGQIQVRSMSGTVNRSTNNAVGVGGCSWFASS